MAKQTERIEQERITVYAPRSEYLTLSAIMKLRKKNSNDPTNVSEWFRQLMKKEIKKAKEEGLIQ